MLPRRYSAEKNIENTENDFWWSNSMKCFRNLDIMYTSFPELKDYTIEHEYDQ